MVAVALFSAACRCRPVRLFMPFADLRPCRAARLFSLIFTPILRHARREAPGALPVQAVQLPQAKMSSAAMSIFTPLTRYFTL